MTRSSRSARRSRSRTAPEHGSVVGARSLNEADPIARARTGGARNPTRAYPGEAEREDPVRTSATTSR